MSTDYADLLRRLAFSKHSVVIENCCVPFNN